MLNSRYLNKDRRYLEPYQAKKSMNELATIENWSNQNYIIVDHEVKVKRSFEDFTKTENWFNYVHNSHIDIV